MVRVCLFPFLISDLHIYIIPVPEYFVLEVYVGESCSICALFLFFVSFLCVCFDFRFRVSLNSEEEISLRHQLSDQNRKDPILCPHLDLLHASHIIM